VAFINSPTRLGYRSDNPAAATSLVARQILQHHSTFAAAAAAAAMGNDILVFVSISTLRASLQ
jgi:small subunit ribosomal protein S30e